MTTLGVAIMAGGAGLRLRPVTGSLPKALAPFCGSTLLRHQLDHARLLAPAATVVLASIGRGHRAICAAAADAQVLVEPSPLGTAGGLFHLPPGCDRWLVVNVDHISDVDRADLVRRATGPCTAVITTVDAKIDEGVVTVTADSDSPRILEWRERPTVRVDVTTGLYVFEDAALRSVLDGAPCDMPDLVRRLVPAGVTAHRHTGTWLDAGTPDRLRAAEALWRGWHSPEPDHPLPAMGGHPAPEA